MSESTATPGSQRQIQEFERGDSNLSVALALLGESGGMPPGKTLKIRNAGEHF